ncbi:hypothetical protein HQ865_11300 [Mucilaginibacter mali]|uniref:Uncharacterized protein n=1 Tax=Mucilaginibacter mali TaxID=2740462 RepID=A0A7D4ULS5_9SPHI|nr:hypothetical protein [Mucilaginibacter mali]QKJ30321.1 hypothetical protein HQ865_11300 [Mucilaginibacter mali]
MRNIFLTGILLLMAVIGHSQSPQNKGKDSTIARLAKKLSVSKKRAAVILEAIEYKRDDFRALLRRTDINPQDKESLLKRMIWERRYRMDSVLTQEERLKWVKGSDSLSRIQRGHRMDIQSRQQKALDKVAHVQKTKSISKDTIRVIKNNQ